MPSSSINRKLNHTMIGVLKTLIVAVLKRAHSGYFMDRKPVIGATGGVGLADSATLDGHHEFLNDTTHSDPHAAKNLSSPFSARKGNHRQYPVPNDDGRPVPKDGNGPSFKIGARSDAGLAFGGEVFRRDNSGVNEMGQSSPVPNNVSQSINESYDDRAALFART
ncbi:uncharacterized protein LOC144151610 [Haemaphysalis longicornis]